MKKRTTYLLAAINLLVGKIRGAIGVLVVLACGLLGAIFGSAFTGIAAVGPIMTPQMIAQGFSRGYATSLVSVSSILGVLIPPIVPLIIYGWVTGTSVLGAFLATVGPAVLLIIIFSTINIL
ncbi:TRAP transporter large permease subunit [Alkalihalobacillus deserti]|uniref:TRAP transporter large permease subunit n=1 Tax=Alkalihalobacillus deserti TaxID=2879466 RepID=UPI00223D4F3F|nr:TRAP transporter large permease subunit [Alkalihalobacillus deserti]